MALGSSSSSSPSCSPHLCLSYRTPTDCEPARRVDRSSLGVTSLRSSRRGESGAAAGAARARTAGPPQGSKPGQAGPSAGHALFWILNRSSFFAAPEATAEVTQWPAVPTRCQTAQPEGAPNPLQLLKFSTACSTAYPRTWLHRVDSLLPACGTNADPHSGRCNEWCRN